MQNQTKGHWSQQTCQHYAKGKGILSNGEQQRYLLELDDGWEITRFENQMVLSKMFSFKRYNDILSFVAKTGKIAEEQNHHPEMVVKWGVCSVNFQTHSAGGITLNDFICAYLLDKIG